MNTTKDFKTVGDLQTALTTHPDVGLALTLQDAIRETIKQKGLKSEAPLTVINLEAIRQMVYELNDPARGNAAADPMMTLFHAMFSAIDNQGSGNTIEDALQYIERLVHERM